MSALAKFRVGILSGEVFVARLTEGVLAAVAWFAMTELAHLRFSTGEWIAVVASWSLGLVFLPMIGARGPWWRGIGVGLEWLWIFGVLFFLNQRFTHALSVGQMLYATGWVGSVVHGWRAWHGWRRTRGEVGAGEPLRVCLVLLAPLVVLAPFFSDRFIGGTDARWYAYMLRDFIDQLRAGVFPVFVGQGEFAWNGGVHPFRSAPVYLHVAGVWDFFTLRSLNGLALQHLTVLTAGVAGALGFYAAATALLPKRRWTAAGFAILYAVAPAWAGVLYCSDAYMSFMVLGVLPAVLYGNARALLSEDGRGYGWLAVGLALAWMSHPPIAMLSTLASVLLQGGSLLLGGASWARWRGVVRGALIFAGLAAYYFASMSELPKAPGLSREDFLQVVGLLLALAGLGNGVLRGRSWRWLWLLPIGATLAAMGRSPWGWWLAGTALLVSGTVAIFRWRRVSPEKYGVAILFAGLVVSAGLVQAAGGFAGVLRNTDSLAGLWANAAHATEFFRLLNPNLSDEGHYQPGVGLWLVLGLLAVGFFRGGGLASKLFLVAAVLPLLAIVPVPGVSEFLVGFAPPGLASLVNLPLTIRLMPVVAGLLAMGGVVWVAEHASTLTRARRRWLGWGLLGAVVFAVWETRPFIRRGWAMTGTKMQSEDILRPENAMLYRFAYDLLRHPDYLSHGVTDPWLQTRLLDVHQVVRWGPDEMAQQMENISARRERLIARTDPTAPMWVGLSPDITIAPGELLLLRFEFDPKVNYTGWLVWTALRGYREYPLPDSGLRLAFGSGPEGSKIVALRNTTDQPQTYHLSVPRGSGNTLVGNGDFFADVTISDFRADSGPVRVKSFIPYRVAVDAAVAGWIETPRVWLPGYRATLDGKTVATKASRQGLAMVAVTPGRHELELRFVGTGKLWAALVVSALTWLGCIVVWLRRATRAPVSGDQSG